MTETDGRTAPPTTGWDRSWAMSERWVPLGLLVLSTVFAALSPEGVGRLETVAIAVAALAWEIARLRTLRSVSRGAGISALGPRHAAVHIVVVLALAALLMSRDVVFFIYTIAGFLHAGALRPLPVVFLGTGSTSFLILAFTWGGVPTTVGGAIAFGAVLVLQTFLIGFGIVGGEKLAAVSEERRRTVQRLQTTLVENEGLHAQLVAQARDAGVEDERRRMAREIHDTVAQGLTGVITQLEAADQAIGHPATLRRHLANAADLARTSLAEARRSMQALGPGPLERGRLEDALDELVADWSQLHGVPATATVTGGAVPRSTEIEVALLRVAQEGLANVAKHAAAHRVGVTLSRLDDRLVLDVRDDGHGFDPDAVNGSISFGLTTMRQRVAALGGELVVESAPGSGTALSASIPTAADATTVGVSTAGDDAESERIDG